MNGGGLAIGPDGHLYVGVGDGGSADDPLDAGQDPSQILGSIVRVDPTPGSVAPYAIPADNPYAEGGGVARATARAARQPARAAAVDERVGGARPGRRGGGGFAEAAA